jgi:hypothetical protein
MPDVPGAPPPKRRRLASAGRCVWVLHAREGAIGARRPGSVTVCGTGMPQIVRGDAKRHLRT